jgi:hypothetical protein
MQNYRTPGAGQATNIRLNELLTAALRSGGTVDLSIVTQVVVTLNGEGSRDLALDRRNGRLIAEQAAISAAAVENLADSKDDAPIYPRLLDRPGVGEAEYE